MLQKLLLKSKTNSSSRGPCVLNVPYFYIDDFHLSNYNKGGYSFALPDIKLKCRTLKHFYLHEYFARADPLNVFNMFLQVLRSLSQCSWSGTWSRM